MLPILIAVLLVSTVGLSLETPNLEQENLEYYGESAEFQNYLSEYQPKLVKRSALPDPEPARPNRPVRPIRPTPPPNHRVPTNRPLRLKRSPEPEPAGWGGSRPVTFRPPPPNHPLRLKRSPEPEPAGWGGSRPVTIRPIRPTPPPNHRVPTNRPLRLKRSPEPEPAGWGGSRPVTIRPIRPTPPPNHRVPTNRPLRLKRSPEPEPFIHKDPIYRPKPRPNGIERFTLPPFNPKLPRFKRSPVAGDDRWSVQPDLQRDNRGNTRGEVEIKRKGEKHDFEAGYAQTFRGPDKHSERWHVGGTFHF